MFARDPIGKTFQTFKPFNRVAAFKSFEGGGLVRNLSMNSPQQADGVSEHNR